MGAVALLVFYFDSETLEHPIDVKTVKDITRRTITTWEDQVAVILDQAFGPIDGRRLFRRYIRTDTRSGLYRESTQPEEVPEDLKRFEQLEAQLETNVLPDTAESATLKIYSPSTLGLTETLRTLQNLSLIVRDEMSLTLNLPEAARRSCRGCTSRRRRRSSRRCWKARSACATRCARFRRSAPPTIRSTGSS